MKTFPTIRTIGQINHSSATQERCWLKLDSIALSLLLLVLLLQPVVETLNISAREQVVGMNNTVKEIMKDSCSSPSMK